MATRGAYVVIASAVAQACPFLTLSVVGVPTVRDSSDYPDVDAIVGRDPGQQRKERKQEEKVQRESN